MINDDLDDSDEKSSVDDDNDTPAKKKHWVGSACNLSLGNSDLSNMVNGIPEDSIALRPFERTFTQENIINLWIAIGFLPMTSNTVNDPKVRYKLGEGGAPEHDQMRIEALVNDYQQSKVKLTELVFNHDILDLKPTIVVNRVLPASKEARIKALMKNGGLIKLGACLR